MDEFLDALAAELRLRCGSRDGARQVETIYLGGGTPSRLGGEGIARAIASLSRYVTLREGGELTLEANPDDVSPQAAELWVKAGVTRVSLGSQSFHPSVLAWMHRSHDVDAISRSVETLRAAGLRNLSLDLIFALPEGVERDLRADVDRLLSLQPDHVSLYGLTVEPGTALGRWVGRGITAERPEEGYETEYLLAHRMLTDAGYEHYEVSSYARPGYRSRHNASYWAGVPYLGFGPSAHGFDGRIRRWNVRAYAAWRDALRDGRDPVEGSELLTADNRIAESVYLGMRSDAGLSLEGDELAIVGDWERAGWVTVDGDRRLRCTPAGWLRLDSLASALTHHRSR